MVPRSGPGSPLPSGWRSDRASRSSGSATEDHLIDPIARRPRFAAPGLDGARRGDSDDEARRRRVRPAVILAQGAGSLGAARVLGRRGVPVIAVLWDLVTPVRYSRFVRRIVEVPPGPDAERELRLLQLLMELGEDRPVLLSSSDRLVAFMARHRETLDRHCALCVPDFALIETLNDKAREVALIAGLGFAVPKTLAPVPPSAAEIEARLGLPVIVKPRSFEHLSLIAGKNLVIHERRALEAFCRARAADLDGLVAQEVIPGPDDAGWVVSCTFNREHELLDCAIKQKIRMSPAHFGGSSFAVSSPNPAVLELTRRLGKALRYSGHAGIEFRWDSRDQRYKYVELNPRLPHNVEFDDFCGLPTTWNSYRVAVDGYASFVPGTQRNGLLYFDVIDDLKGRLGDGERLGNILADYARNLARKKDGVYFAWDDPRPGLWITARVIKAGLQRLRRRARRRPVPRTPSSGRATGTRSGRASGSCGSRGLAL